MERGDDWNDCGKDAATLNRCRKSRQAVRMHAPTVTTFQLNMSCDTRTIVESHWGARKEKLQERTDLLGGGNWWQTRRAMRVPSIHSRLAQNRFSCRRETIRFFQDQLIGPCDAQMSMWRETLGMWTSPTQKKKTKLHTIGPLTATRRTNTNLKAEYNKARCRPAQSRVSKVSETKFLRLHRDAA